MKIKLFLDLFCFDPPVFFYERKLQLISRYIARYYEKKQHVRLTGGHKRFHLTKRGDLYFH